MEQSDHQTRSQALEELRRSKEVSSALCRISKCSAHVLGSSRHLQSC